MNVETTYVDASKPSNVEKAIRSNTKLVWLESPTNPLLKVMDIKKIAEIVHKKDILLAVDNTFLTSYFQVIFPFKNLKLTCTVSSTWKELNY
jgi:cystathionine gamma-lyase